MSIYATIELSKSGQQALPAELDPKNEGLIYGSNLVKVHKELDALAKQAGVLPISTFFDDSAMMSDEEREEMGLPPAKPKWASIEDGLRTIDALVAKLEADGAGLDKLWDLKASQQILKNAIGSGEQFRFSLA